MSKINNNEVETKIKKLRELFPTHKEEDIVDAIVEDKSVRLQKPAIRSMVKQFFHRNKVPVNMSTPPVDTPKQQQQPEATAANGLPKKKKKLDTSKQDFAYQPKESDALELLGGINEVIKKVREEILVSMKQRHLFKILGVDPPKGFLIIGAMGCGKSRLGLGILHEAKIVHAFNTFYLTSSQIINQAEESLEKLFKDVSENQPSIVFIDDVEVLCSKENKKQSSALLSLLGHLNRLQDKQIYLIGSTSYPEKVDISLKRAGRFDEEITIDNPNDQARLEILSKLIESVKTDLKSRESIADVISRTAGYVAADLVKLVKKAALETALRQQEFENSLNIVDVEQEPSISLADFRLALTKIQPLCKKEGFTTIPDVTLDDVGALGDLKKQLIESIILPIKERHNYRKMGVALNAGVLLFGPPGCGKTMLAKAIANEAKASFITVKGPELLSKYVGESQESVRKVFQRARLSAPCIIFFDEFDALAPKRSDNGNQVTERVVNTLLNELNGVEDRKMVFVIAATNRKDIIDEAILRSGRIEKHLKVPLPTREDRLQILKTITKKLPLDTNVDLQEIASHSFCEGFSGADLQHLVNQASISAITNHKDNLVLGQNDFLQALAKLVANKHV